MSEDGSVAISNKQRLFIRYTYMTLVDLVVLNLFSQFHDKVFIESFSISLFAAILMQFLLQVTFYIEHKAAQRFIHQTGITPKVKRAIVTWIIIFLSKFVILGAVNFIFGDKIQFLGDHHGIVTFLIVVIVIIMAERNITKLYKSLA